MGQKRWTKGRDESKERDILNEGAIMELARNLALKKFPGSARMTPAKTSSNKGKGAQTGSQIDEYL